LAAAAIVGAGVPAVMLLVGVMACGPDFEPEVFVPAHQPESPKLYADGHLGVVEPWYYHAEMVVAYRYLSGGTLSEMEKASYVSPPLSTSQQDLTGEGGPAERWRAARLAAVGLPVNTLDYSTWVRQERTFKQNADNSIEMDFMLNCPDAAFLTAMDTMHLRVNRWDAKSPEFAEWLRGQDAVFSNCSKAGAMPDAAKPEWPLLLRQDRAYQIAAAKFYSADYDGAIADFEAIGADKASPWNVWGEYLAARAEVRKAASVPSTAAPYSTTLGSFDPAGLKAAQTRLLRLMQQTKDSAVKHAAEAELAFVEVRLSPGKRLDEVSAALSGPKPDTDFARDLADLDYLMDRGVTGDSDLAQWIKEMQFSSPNPSTPKPAPLKALSMWRTRHSVPWMVAAISQAKGADADGGGLVAAVAGVKRESPAYVTVNYYRIDWLLGAKKNVEARILADTVIGGMGLETMASTRNAFLGQRMQTARTLNEFLADAPRTVIEEESSAADMAKCANPQDNASGPCTATLPPQEFDADAASAMNMQMPLAVLEQAAESTALPLHLRQAVAEVAWVRALGLGDQVAVSRMSRLLPEPVRKTAGESIDFPATLALLRAPGLRPFLSQGVQRSISYSNMDHYRDNWWCGRWTDDSSAQGNQQGGSAPVQPTALGFLTAQQRQQAESEASQLNKLPSGLVWTAQRAISYVKAHPTDKEAAETLALIVQGTHWGCDVDYRPQAAVGPQRAVSKEAFEMLHRLYPKSAWALKTKYYY
jgi:hypothetical protein